LLAGAAYAAALAAPAHAQTARTAEAAAVDTADAAELGEVVVTARRTEERAQDVPIPLSVVGGERLEDTGAYTLADLQNQVPSLVAFNANPRNSAVGIRGIGVSTASDGLDTSVGVYVDGVYLGRPGMALTDLIDIQQVEVLRGPQGTLFGRNTSAGVLNITTRKPTFDPSLTAELSVGDHAYNQARVSVNGPIVEGLLAGRLTAFNTHRDGVFDNLTTGVGANSIGRSGVRGQLLFTPAPQVDVRLIAEYADEDDTCCVSVITAVLPPTTSAAVGRTLTAFNQLGYTPLASDNSVGNAPQNMRTDSKAISAEVNWDLGFADLTGIAAWRYWHFDPLQDSDGTSLDIIQKNAAITRDWQWTQEVRLASKPGRFEWQAGAYYFRQLLKDHFILNQFGSDAGAFYTAFNRLTNPAAPAVVIAPGSQYIGDTRARSDSWAVFGQANYELTDRLTFTGGLRYTHDKRHGITVTSTRGAPYGPTSIPFNYDVEVKGGEWSYLASLAYKVTDDVLAYGSFSTGHKAAGLNLNAAVTAGSPLVLKPETVENWEMGLKTTLFDNRVTFNVSAFWADLSGLQANISPSNGARQYLANVGDIRSKGIEVDAALEPFDGLTASLSGSYNDVTYASYPNAPCAVGVAAPCDLTGKRVFQAPKWVANAQVRYEFDWNDRVRPYAQGQVAYRSAVFGQVDNSPFSRIDGYAVTNARIGAEFGEGRYDISLWVNNLFDKAYFNTLGSSAIVGAAVYAFSGQLGPPRTFGATLRAEF
jgi:iron complex outermembrane receptor protein